MIETRYICDVCKETISITDTYINIKYRIDNVFGIHVSDESCIKCSSVDLCPECYRKLKVKLKPFFNNSKGIGK